MTGNPSRSDATPCNEPGERSRHGRHRTGRRLVGLRPIWSGGRFGKWIGIAGASLSAVGALLSLPGYPFWSLAVFAMDLLIIYGLSAYGGQRSRAAAA